MPERPSLTFNPDGTLPANQLEGLPSELVARLTSPEFIEQARQRIAHTMAAERVAAHLREDGRKIRERAQLEHEARRPSGVSGRQRKRLRRLARSIAARESAIG
jgi:hypothetical protein